MASRNKRRILPIVKRHNRALIIKHVVHKQSIPPAHINLKAIPRKRILHPGVLPTDRLGIPQMHIDMIALIRLASQRHTQTLHIKTVRPKLQFRICLHRRVLS